jgi:hypothetical protein
MYRPEPVAVISQVESAAKEEPERRLQSKPNWEILEIWWTSSAAIESLTSVNFLRLAR